MLRVLRTFLLLNWHLPRKSDKKNRKILLGGDDWPTTVMVATGEVNEEGVFIGHGLSPSNDSVPISRGFYVQLGWGGWCGGRKY